MLEVYAKKVNHLVKGTTFEILSMLSNFRKTYHLQKCNMGINHLCRAEHYDTVEYMLVVNPMLLTAIDYAIVVIETEAFPNGCPLPRALFRTIGKNGMSRIRPIPDYPTITEPFTVELRVVNTIINNYCVSVAIDKHLALDLLKSYRVVVSSILEFTS